MSPRSSSTAARYRVAVVLLIASGCTTGGPVLTGSSQLGSATPTPGATATPLATPTPTPTPAATPSITPSTSPSPAPSPGTGQAVTIVEGSLSLQGGFVAIFTTFPLDQAGSLDFVADWASPANDIDIALANGACSADQLNAGACSFAGLEESATMKPEELVLALPTGSYTPLVGNFSAATESITYRIMFTPNPAASASGVSAYVAAARTLPPPITVMRHAKLGTSR